jgi:hypothetical protein
MTQALNPAANPPLVISVIPPGLRVRCLRSFCLSSTPLAWVGLTGVAGRLGATPTAMAAYPRSPTAPDERAGYELTLRRLTGLGAVGRSVAAQGQCRTTLKVRARTTTLWALWTMMPMSALRYRRAG